MTRFRQMPDIEAVVGFGVRAASIATLGTRVYSSVPATPTYPLVVIERTGGVPPVREYSDSGELQFWVWGTSKAEARDIADAVRVAVLELEGETIEEPVRAVVLAVDDLAGLRWDPDARTGRDRYRFSMAVHARSV